MGGKTTGRQYAAVIVAAGCSRRMKKFKPLLPLGEGCILQSTIGSFQKAGIEKIVVVVGYKRHQVIPLLRKLKVGYVENLDYDETDMMESVKMGVRAVAKEADGIFICPGDVPLIDPKTIERVVRTFEQTKPMVLIPTYLGKTGHPPICSKEVAEKMDGYNGEEGLRGVWKQFAGQVRTVEVPDEEILQDTDLPRDYERLQKAYELRRMRKKGEMV